MSNLNILDSLIDYTEIKIKLCGDVTHDKNWIEKGNKLDYDLWVILDGELLLEFENKYYNLKTKDMLFLSPRTFYKACATTNSCHFIYVHFDFRIGNNITALDEFIPEGPISNDKLYAQVDSFIKSYFNYKKSNPLSALELRGYFSILLAKILILTYEARNINSEKKSAAPKSLIQMQPVLNYISKHLYEPIYIRDLANIANLTEKYFIALFKYTIGTTPAQYITQAKMNKALTCIYQGTYSIKEIAYLLGYADQYTFSKTFKKHFGVSPSKML